MFQQYQSKFYSAHRTAFARTLLMSSNRSSPLSYSIRQAPGRWLHRFIELCEIAVRPESNLNNILPIFLNVLKMMSSMHFQSLYVRVGAERQTLSVPRSHQSPHQFHLRRWNLPLRFVTSDDVTADVARMNLAALRTRSQQWFGMFCLLDR